MLVKTIKRHRYAGEMHERGDEYELTGNHVKLLEAVGRIRRIAGIVSFPLEEEEKPVEEKKKKAKKKTAKKKGKRKYKRKDMVAE